MNFILRPSQLINIIDIIDVSYWVYLNMIVSIEVGSRSFN